MSLNYNLQNSSKENFINGYINDFTDCIDFTKQYQKSCGFEEENSESVNGVQIAATEKKDNEFINSTTDIEKKAEKIYMKCNVSNDSLSTSVTSVFSAENSKHEENTDLEANYHPMEPDVSITIGETNLEKTINHVALGADSIKNNQKLLDLNLNKNCKKKANKQKLIKKNHFKLPLNKNIKKKVALFKFKKGKCMKKRSDLFQFPDIQSNIKFKCYKCSYSDLSSYSELQSHQRKCITGATDYQTNKETSSFTNSPSSNFRITRKVYLCSACGSYYENWNLFLHMKEMHKRHICLYCLGMFSQPDKLAQHLQAKHNVIEQTLSSIDEFLKIFKGTCYLICVSCEAMFFEQEDFFKHSCILQSEDIHSCPLCGLHGAHFPTCRRAFSDHYLEPESQKSHPALGKKLNFKKKKVNNKKTKDMFHIINNDNTEMSVIVRKQNKNDIPEASNDLKSKNNTQVQKNIIESSMVTALRNSNEDLVSAKHYNEKMLQLYKPNKTCEKVISSIQSIEDSINRVVENLRMTEKRENDKEDESECFDADVKNSEDQKNELLGNEKVNSISSAGQCLHLNEPFDSNKSLTMENKSVLQLDEKQNDLMISVKCESINDNNSQQKSSENIDLSESESTDSEKLTIAFDNPSEQGLDKTQNVTGLLSALPKQEDNIPTASKDSSYIFVEVKDECMEVKSLIKEFVKVSCWNCVYCSHAKRIALNGKQLALHILAEHRFVTVPESSSEEEKEQSALNIIQRLKVNLNVLGNFYFNTDTFDSENKSSWKVNDRIYECFHCLFATYVHKELCSHNRKMHQKAMFLCIMCKSNFYTYSELLCHLCPGIYVSGQVINPDITYRCFLCDIEPLPSSFRLMVHLRRKHNSCDICFDQSSNQFQLSTHVWKHKLSHMCYRCGIAYRNKPDITKHLFWKHGTESVMCKKCLQKKWPHVYHFCVPPTCFICDECSLTLKSAIALKVHKRLHSGEYPYPCSKCEEKFISRKLLNKHLEKHEEKVENIHKPEMELNTRKAESDKIIISKKEETSEEVKNVNTDINCTSEAEKKTEKEKKPKKRKVLKDVFDLPPVNLSESDDSDQGELDTSKVFQSESPFEASTPIPNGYLNGIQKDEPSPSQIVDGVWNNFQNYLVAKDMPKTFKPPSPFRNMTLSRIKEIMLSDHDYYIIPNSNSQDSKQLSVDTEKPSEESKKVGLDHDYCNNVQKGKISCKSKQKIKRREDASKSSSSDSSSDSDSSCSCGSNCSCSSGSSSSTSSNDSDSDSREKRKQKKVIKDKNMTNKATAEASAEVDISVHDVPSESLIKESDLDTDETETDEDFYDYNPAREANKILAEKRTQLLANLNGSEAAMSSPTTGVEKPITPKKKSKFKKKKSQLRLSSLSKSSQKKGGTLTIPLNKNRVYQFSDTGIVKDGNVNVSHEPFSNQIYGQTDITIRSPGDLDSKRPKRKRVPLKFYGFSSDDDSETTPVSKKRDKSEYNSVSLPVSTTINSSLDAYSSNSTLWSPGSKSAFSWRIEKNEAVTPKVNPIKIKTSQSSGKLTPTVENPTDEEEQLQKRPERNFQVNGNPVAQKGEKLYCFCQCPYDEVSEMIACDAEDCLIEWFHFECVGIMVPPKGSWYCPDCRKKLAAENEFMPPSANEQILN